MQLRSRDARHPGACFLSSSSSASRRSRQHRHPNETMNSPRKQWMLGTSVPPLHPGWGETHPPPPSRRPLLGDTTAKRTKRVDAASEEMSDKRTKFWCDPSSRLLSCGRQLPRSSSDWSPDAVDVSRPSPKITPSGCRVARLGDISSGRAGNGSKFRLRRASDGARWGHPGGDKNSSKPPFVRDPISDSRAFSLGRTRVHLHHIPDPTRSRQLDLLNRPFPALTNPTPPLTLPWRRELSHPGYKASWTSSSWTGSFVRRRRCCCSSSIIHPSFLPKLPFPSTLSFLPSTSLKSTGSSSSVPSLIFRPIDL